jgi:SAM-dependent methyltransferase
VSPDDAPADPETRRRWAEVLTERARAHWTPARTAALGAGKRLLLPPAEAAPLLRAIGLLEADGSMPPRRVRKFLQVNHMVALLLPELRALRGRGALALLDAGCGRSYLSLVLAWYARHAWGQPLTVLGVDRDAAVIDEARRRAALADLAEVARFEAAPLAALDVGAAWARAFSADAGGAPPIDAVLALHACDTATCDALALGVGLGASLLAVAPCCQAELARGWARLAEAGAAGAFAPVWSTPHLRRELAAELTDALRAELLRAVGYRTRALEFVPSEHTRKNTLLVGLRDGAAAPGAWAAYARLRDATGGVGLALAERLGLGAAPP